MPDSRFRDRLLRADPLSGVWCNLRDPLAVEIVARAGFDWIALDLQHGSATATDLGPLLALAATAGPSAGLVRVAWNDPALIMAALDAGAAGVIVPVVTSADQAAAVAAACRYPPRGVRSWGPVRWLVRDPEYAPVAANAATTCAVMVESPAAVEQVGRIAAVEEVDCVFVGPYDLALASGTTVEELLEGTGGALEQVVAACRAAGTAAGAYGGTPALAARLRAAGFTLVATATDTALLAAAAAAAVRQGRREQVP